MESRNSFVIDDFTYKHKSRLLRFRISLDTRCAFRIKLKNSLKSAFFWWIYIYLEWSRSEIYAGCAPTTHVLPIREPRKHYRIALENFPLSLRLRRYRRGMLWQAMLLCFGYQRWERALRVLYRQLSKFVLFVIATCWMRKGHTASWLFLALRMFRLIFSTGRILCE